MILLRTILDVADNTGARRASFIGVLKARGRRFAKIGEIIRALEGPIAPMECAGEAESAGESCRNSDCCATRIFWQKLRDSIVNVIDSTTLADLVALTQELNQTEAAKAVRVGSFRIRNSEVSSQQKTRCYVLNNG